MIESARLPAYFITLTLSDEFNQAAGPGLERDSNELFETYIRRWRKRLYKKNIKERHFFITERGQNASERIHAHGVVICEEIGRATEQWTWGWVDIGKKGVCESTIPYLMKYILKPDEKHESWIPKIFASKGIGKEYLKKYGQWHRNIMKDYYRNKQGYKVKLSDYLKNKIFSTEEREAMRLEKQDEKVLYVKGMKFDISTREGVKQYAETLAYYQRIAPAYERPRRNKKNQFGIFQEKFQSLQQEVTTNYEDVRGAEAFALQAGGAGTGANEAHSKGMAARI